MPEQRWDIRSSEDLGRAVADIRRARGLTQADLARNAGIGRPMVAKLETGKSSRLLDHFLRLLRRMGATVTVTYDTDSSDIHHGET